jgi:hypothetical protein
MPVPMPLTVNNAHGVDRITEAPIRSDHPRRVAARGRIRQTEWHFAIESDSRQRLRRRRGRGGGRRWSAGGCWLTTVAACGALVMIATAAALSRCRSPFQMADATSPTCAFPDIATDFADTFAIQTADPKTRRAYNKLCGVSCVGPGLARHFWRH